MQAQHELKRKDAEYERLQARLRGGLGAQRSAGALESPGAGAATFPGAGAGAATFPGAGARRPGRGSREQEELHKVGGVGGV